MASLNIQLTHRTAPNLCKAVSLIIDCNGKFIQPLSNEMCCVHVRTCKRQGRRNKKKWDSSVRGVLSVSFGLSKARSDSIALVSPQHARSLAPGPGIIYTGPREAWENTMCYKISLVQLINNLNVILYLSTCHTVYTECHRRNVRDLGRVFLMLNYTDITQNTYIQSWTFTEIMAIEKCGLLGGPRTVRRPWHHTRTLRMLGN